MSQAIQKPVIDYGQKPAARAAWFNARVLIFVLVIGGIFAFPAYWVINEATSKGITYRADGYAEVNLKTISIFPFDQQYGTLDDIPKRFRELDGKKVILVGEMYAPNAATPQIKEFDLCYSVAKCCFSGDPQVQHFVKSTSTTKTLMPYYDGPVRVMGTFKINVTKAEGKVTSVYHLAVDSIEPV